MDLKHVLALNLRRIRQTKDLTQEDLAELTGLSSRYIGSIERARVSASVSILGQIADALGVPASELVKQTPSASEQA